MYHWDAKDYSKSAGEQQKWARELIRQLDLRGNERILDIGCGDGLISFEIAERLPNGSVTGIDCSQTMINYACEHYREGQVANLQFVVMDAQDIHLDKKVDVVFSNACLHWAKDHEAVLHGIKACLAPSGRVLLQMGGKGNAGAILEILYAMIDQSPWQEYFKEFSFPYGFYGPEEYTVWMNQAGLILKRAELIPKDMVHQGKEGLLAWIRTTWLPYTDRVPEPLREVFMEELARLYIKAYPVDEKGQIHISMMRLEVEATNRD